MKSVFLCFVILVLIFSWWMQNNKKQNQELNYQFPKSSNFSHIKDKCKRLEAKYKDFNEKETSNFVKGFNNDKKEIDLTEYYKKRPQYPFKNFKILFILISHKFNTRIFEKIFNKDDYFMIHLDIKETLSPNYQIIENVFLFSYKNVSWGGFSQVQLQLIAMRIGIELFKDFQYVINLSMDDFPVQSIFSLKKELSNRAQFFNTFNINYVESGYAGNHLFKDAYLDCNGTISPLFWYKRPPKIEIFSGSSWFILSKDFIVYILNDKNMVPVFKHYMRNLLFCDEMFFQTVLHHSNFTFINDNLRFISWEYYSKECIGNICGRRPAYLRTRQIDPILVNPDIFFVRKVGNDSEVIQALESKKEYKKKMKFIIKLDNNCLKSLESNVTFEICNYQPSQHWIIGPCTNSMIWKDSIPSSKETSCWVMSYETGKCLEWNSNSPNEIIYLGKCSNYLVQFEEKRMKILSKYQPPLYFQKEGNLLILKDQANEFVYQRIID